MVTSLDNRTACDYCGNRCELPCRSQLYSSACELMKHHNKLVQSPEDVAGKEVHRQKPLSPQSCAHCGSREHKCETSVGWLQCEHYKAHTLPAQQQQVQEQQPPHTLEERHKERRAPVDRRDSLNTQVGGSHYKDFKIQPVEYMMENAIPYMEGNVIKYVSRWKTKGGIQDLKKARHYLDLLIEREEQVAAAQSSQSGQL